MSNKIASLVLGVCGAFSIGTTQAAYLTESHSVNDSFSTAQFIDSIYFTDWYDRDINTEAGVNVSETSLHASVLGSGDGSVDFYSFNAVAGQAYFDIDYGMDFGGSFDPWIELYDANFTLLSQNDDSVIESGSFHSYDSFISYQFQSDDLYYIAVGSFPYLGSIPFGSNYTLHVTQDVAPVPVPAAVWLFGAGLLSLVGVARRKQS